jgi:hypothetical protein
MQVGIDVGATKIESVLLEKMDKKNTDLEYHVQKITLKLLLQ